MATPFIHVTTIAIEEILSQYIEPSKFGYFLSETDKKLLVDELVKFVETSRHLKDRGDRLLEEKTQQNKKPGASSAPRGVPRQTKNTI